MTLAEQLKRLQEVEDRLNGGGVSAITAFAADLVADIADRVINTGETATGGKFSAYSDKKGPAFWYQGRSINVSGEAKVKAAAKRGDGVSYKDFREFNNRPTAFKNFSFSQELWRGFGVKSVTFNGSEYTLSYGGKTKESAEKIEWMNGQEGQSIVAASKEESERLNRAITKYMVGG